MTDLRRTVEIAIARIRELPPDTLTITEINVVEMLEAALVDHPISDRFGDVYADEVRGGTSRIR